MIFRMFLINGNGGGGGGGGGERIVKNFGKFRKVYLGVLKNKI